MSSGIIGLVWTVDFFGIFRILGSLDGSIPHAMRSREWAIKLLLRFLGRDLRVQL